MKLYDPIDDTFLILKEKKRKRKRNRHDGSKMDPKLINETKLKRFSN